MNIQRGLLACATAAVIATMAGCSAGAHQIIDPGKACESCHGEKQTYDVAAPQGATECGTHVTVETSADSVTVCSPIFTSENGSSYVPERQSQAKATDGKAELTLDEGTWVLCTADGNDVKSAKVVVVNANSEDGSITL